MQIPFTLFAKLMHDQRKSPPLIPVFKLARGDHQASDHRGGGIGIESASLCEERAFDLCL